MVSKIHGKTVKKGRVFIRMLVLYQPT